MFYRVIAAAACVLFLAGCQQTGDPSDGIAGPAGPSPIVVTSSEGLPFHSEVVWDVEQVRIPPGHCTQAIPTEFSYLWFSRIWGTATSTHLGTGPYEIDLCLYGILTDSEAAPPNNGIPMAWYAERQVWTAANGDQLKATGALIGFTAPPGTPGFKFIESLTFLSGGTGRFDYAEGSGQGIVDSTAQTAVYDGRIRYGKEQK